MFLNKWHVLLYIYFLNLKLFRLQKVIDIDALNKDLVSQDYNLWDAHKSSKWLSFDSIEVI